MKIRIKDNAVDIYIAEHTDYNGNYFGRDKWERAMEKLSGQTVEVDTEVLFKHEFNTMPIAGVTKKGIRIMEEYVEEVIDDERCGKAYCEFCNSVSTSTEVCTNCGKSDYLESLCEEEEEY